MDEEWRLQANCRGVNWPIFFPNKGDNARSRKAKAICHECEVRWECLDYALEHNIKFGIWGGFSEHERREYQGYVGRVTVGETNG
jgi:WhiB family redox-sensing transcriptional regulator